MSTPTENSRVEVRSCVLFPPGYVLKVGHRTYLQVVDKLDHADGGVFLGGMADLENVTEGVIAFFFTYYVTRANCDAVDHQATIDAIEWLTPEGMNDIARLVRADIQRRSITAALCFNPFVSFFDKLDVP